MVHYYMTIVTEYLTICSCSCPHPTALPAQSNRPRGVLVLFVDPPTDRDDVNRPPAPCERHAATQFIRDSTAMLGQMSRKIVPRRCDRVAWLN